MYSQIVSYLGFCSTEDQIHNGTNLSVAYVDNIMLDDTLATLGARALPGMVLIPKARIICLLYQKSW